MVTARGGWGRLRKVPGIVATRTGWKKGGLLRGNVLLAQLPLLPGDGEVLCRRDGGQPCTLGSCLRVPTCLLAAPLLPDAHQADGAHKRKKKKKKKATLPDRPKEAWAERCATLTFDPG